MIHPRVYSRYAHETLSLLGKGVFRGQFKSRNRNRIRIRPADKKHAHLHYSRMGQPRAANGLSNHRTMCGD